MFLGKYIPSHLEAKRNIPWAERKSLWILMRDLYLFCIFFHLCQLQIQIAVWRTVAWLSQGACLLRVSFVPWRMPGSIQSTPVNCQSLFILVNALLTCPFEKHCFSALSEYFCIQRVLLWITGLIFDAGQLNVGQWWGNAREWCLAQLLSELQGYRLVLPLYRLAHYFWRSKGSIRWNGLVRERYIHVFSQVTGTVSQFVEDSDCRSTEAVKFISVMPCSESV